MSYFSSVLFHFSFHLFFSHTVHPDYILPFFEALDPQDFPHHLLQHITNGPDGGVGHHFDSGPRELVSSPVLSHHQGEFCSIVPDSTQLAGICKGRYSFPSFRSSGSVLPYLQHYSQLYGITQTRCRVYSLECSSG